MRSFSALNEMNGSGAGVSYWALMSCSVELLMSALDSSPEVCLSIAVLK